MRQVRGSKASGADHCCSSWASVGVDSGTGRDGCWSSSSEPEMEKRVQSESGHRHSVELDQAIMDNHCMHWTDESSLAVSIVTDDCRRNFRDTAAGKEIIFPHKRA